MNNNRKTKSPAEIATDFVSDSIETATAAFSPESAVAKESAEAITQSASVYKARFSDLQLKGVEIAEANAKAAFNFWCEAMTMKSPDALFSLQQNFMKAQAETAMRQVEDVNGLTMALVRDAAAPVQASVSKVFAALQPKQAA